MEGSVEHMRALASAGELTGERLDAALDGLAATAKRMERYTDHIRDLDALEDTEARLVEVSVPDFLHRAAETVKVLAEGAELKTEASFDVPACTVGLDREIFYRVLENVFSNAVRYAKARIDLAFSLQGETLRVRVSDDGPGFSAQMLKRKQSLYYSEDPTGGHLGLGLATGRVLCARHGGELKISNAPSGGASVEMTFSVKRI